MLKESFLNPDNEFTPIPFWFWNDSLSKAEIKRQINDFSSKGVMGFVIHPRIGLPKDIEYLSDRYMEYVKYAVEQAAKLQMRVILYDEGMYPSGSAHGMVVKDNPEYASRGLKMLEYPCNGELDINVQLNDGDRIVSVQAISKTNNKPVKRSIVKIKQDGRRITFQKPNQQVWSVLVFVETYSKGTIRGIHFGEDDGEPNAPASGDLLNEKAMRKFISITHEKYYAVLKEYFGSTIMAMFTDEPGILGRNAKKGLIPWTEGFLNFFINCGNDELDLPALFLDMGPISEAVRRNYKKAVNKKLEGSYYIPLSKWCEEHGIQLTGHPEKSDEIGLLKHFHIPGQDVVWRWVAPEDGKAISGEHSTIGKCSSDAARHYGKRRNSNECFGCCGPNGIHWAFSSDDMKWYLDWLFVRGVNLIYPHAFFYSVKGEERYGERPPDVGPNNIWWKYYNSISCYIKRMSWLMTDSVNQAKVAVLCEEDHLPWKIVKPLFQNQIEFNYLEYNLLNSKACEIKEGSINIQKQQYSILLIEDETLYTGEIKEKVNNFIETGGEVILYNPNHISGHDKIRNIIDYGQVVENIRKLAPKDILIKPVNDNLRVSHVVKDGFHFYILVNEGEKAIEGEIYIYNTGSVEKWDAWAGKTEEMTVKLHGNGQMRTYIKLDRRESIVISVDPQKSPLIKKQKTKECKAITLINSIDNWVVTRADCTPYIAEKLQSWHQWDGFRGYSGMCEYKTSFHIDGARNIEKIELDLGKVHEIAHVYVNGKDMGFKMYYPYVFDIKSALIQGKNELKVEVINSKANHYINKTFTSGLIGPVIITTEEIA